ncbi:MAG: DoxX family protein [Candidatus Marinimicrobia bacterium]|nr:DoxX family protein [Candidatus Neomarinimicrobiota bacterium]
MLNKLISHLTALEPYAYALLRIVSGFLFFWHGSAKVLDYPAAHAGAPFYITWITGPIELLGGLLIMIGLFTRPAAFLSAGLMAVAYWWKHGLDAILPIINHGELAVIYCFIFLYITARGSGICSIENYRSKQL